MTPQKAKETIEALLNLGTLKGVEVVYEDNEYTTFITAHPYNNDFVYTDKDGWLSYVDSLDYYRNIKSIEPIPMELKLLEVGTRVKVIDNHSSYYGAVGTIEFVDTDSMEYTLCIDGIAHFSFYHVIPESLLVEEKKEAIVLTEFLNEGYRMTPEKTYRTSVLVPIEHVEEALEQAGYKIVKE